MLLCCPGRNCRYIRRREVTAACPNQQRVLFQRGALHHSESGFTSGALYEREADLFGVELLIPEFLFQKHRRKFSTGLDGVKRLAELFQTSLTATGIRYASLCTEPVAVMVSEGDRILYSVLSKPFASRFGARAGRQVPVESVTLRLNSGGRVVAEERDVVRAKQWFAGAPGELAEEAIALGRYGKTLTVLSVKE